MYMDIYAIHKELHELTYFALVWSCKVLSVESWEIQRNKQKCCLMP